MGNQKNRRAVEKPLSPRELSAFCAQLAMLVRSGIPAAEAISIMRGDAGGGPGGELLAAIGARLEDRAALGTALAETGVFPRYFVSMVEIGETSGRLDEVLDAVGHGIIGEEELLRALESRSPTTEAVLTGRNPGQKLCELADYISDMQAVKHPYQKGITARAGIEY